MSEKCALEVWNCKNISDDNLLKYINNLITDKEYIKSAIAKKYVLQQEGRGDKFLNLPKKKDYTFIFSVNEKSKYKVNVDTIQLYLFETKVGFVVFKFNYQAKGDNKKI